MDARELHKCSQTDCQEQRREEISTEVIPEHELDRRFQDEKQHRDGQRERRGPDRDEQPEERQGDKDVDCDVGGIPPGVVITEERVTDASP